jgi:hypothetical protein
MSYTSHAIQLFCMSCNFKPFKTSFKRGKNNAMVRNNWPKLNNIMLVGCVNKTFVQKLSKHNIKSRFKLHECGLWTLGQWMTRYCVTTTCLDEKI